MTAQQLHLFDAETQRREIARVRKVITGAVLAFCRAVGVGGTFRAFELHRYVERHHGSAPASADRILRDLRQQKAIGYVVEDRAGSLYRITAVS